MYRWHDGVKLFEYTPTDQSDLNGWREMLSLGDLGHSRLETAAEATASNHRSHGVLFEARQIKGEKGASDSFLLVSALVPRGQLSAGEYCVVRLFQREGHVYVYTWSTRISDQPGVIEELRKSEKQRINAMLNLVPPSAKDLKRIPKGNAPNPAGGAQ